MLDAYLWLAVADLHTVFKKNLRASTEVDEIGEQELQAKATRRGRMQRPEL